MELNKIYLGDACQIIKTFSDESIDCCITSPPYWGLRDYGIVGQLGLEKTPEEYVAKLVEIFREVKRVLKKEGTLWLNLGDCYAGGGRGGADEKWSSEKQLSNRGCLGMPRVRISEGLKPKDLVGIPWAVAFALRNDGWYLRQDIIWYKPNSMPESVKDRCGKAHEYVFLLAKNQKYYFDYKAIQEAAAYDGRKQERMRGSTKYADKELVPGNSPHTFAARGHVRWSKNEEGERVRNKRSVWIVNNRPFKEAHFATYPEDLTEPMIKAGCPQGGVVLDPFMGSGTTAVVAKKLGRNYIGIELNPKYIEIAEKRLLDKFGMFK